MRLRSIAAVGATIAVLLGGWLALGGFTPLQALSGLALGSAAGAGVHLAYAVLALGRVVGASVAALGLVLLTVAWTDEGRVHAAAATAGGTFVTVIALVQQLAIWETTIGWVLVAGLGLLTVASSPPVVSLLRERAPAEER